MSGGPVPTPARQTEYKPLLKWYREDRGRHTIDESLLVLERGGSAAS